jgi:hypothetical protein
MAYCHVVMFLSHRLLEFLYININDIFSTIEYYIVNLKDIEYETYRIVNNVISKSC